MLSPSLTIACFTLHEAFRNRLLLFTIVVLVSLFGITEFMGDIVITEKQAMQSASLGYILRIFSIFLTCLFVITSMVREFNDKGFELILSLPVQRWNYYLGKFLGFSIMAFFIAIIVSLPLMLYATAGQVAFWSASLFCEMLIMISISFLCLFTFGNITISFLIVTAFYVLSRVLSGIILLSTNPVLNIDSMSQEFIGVLLSIIAAVLPDLSQFTKTEWLIYGGADISTMIPVVIQSLIYIPLISSAALFDLYRKNF